LGNKTGCHLLNPVLRRHFATVDDFPNGIFPKRAEGRFGSAASARFKKFFLLCRAPPREKKKNLLYIGEILLGLGLGGRKKFFFAGVFQNFWFFFFFFPLAPGVFKGRFSL